MSKVEQILRRETYWRIVQKTSESCNISPELVDKIIRKFWRAVLLYVIFGLGSINIRGFGTITPDPKHKRHRAQSLKLRKRIFNRRTEAIYNNKARKKSRTLLFSIKLS